MPFHLSVFHASVGLGPLQLNALQEAVIAPSANGFLVPPVINKVIRVVGVGGLLNRAQLNSASIRDYTPFDIDPVNVGVACESPVREIDLNDNPIPLVTNEELDAFVTNSGAGPTRTTVGVVFADGPTTPVKGRMFTVHWTSAVALSAAFVWAAVTPVFDNGIPSGTFALVGSRQNSATAQFHRFIPRGGPAYRPGTTSMTAYDGAQNMKDRYGRMGEWMRFTNTTPPTIEVLALAADATQDGFLDLIQVG